MRKNIGVVRQCTIAAVQDTFNIKNDYIFKSASGLGAGCGLLCDGICGGYSGGIMVMSALFGRRREFFDNDEEEKTLRIQNGCLSS